MQALFCKKRQFLQNPCYTADMDSRGRPAQTERSPVGQRIVQARKNAGLSQKELAERLGITQQSVVVLERRAANVQANTLIKLAEILKVSVDSLLGLEKEPPKEEVPGGRCRKTFTRVSRLPRRQQERILATVDDMLIAQAAKQETS